ncbi:sensor histidine kinase [Acanthopleuribacter pedis]|uniref:Histidine kinase n=1 Tax=Acanthopleuribacter pedis TaxID=442870 RepID=A0A8J7Q3E9_9BACT|nr:histidine kinase [Acanthopleuribacter pedis]MBO1317679.1 histidine kinase [Acanthopleuribacter pedis]
MEAWKASLGFVGYLLGALTLQHVGARDLLLVYLTLALLIPISYLISKRASQRDKLQSLREESLRAEVLMLKNQINPHFFFNTLNNLYGLTLAQSPQAPEMILKLSDMMRFTIYEGRKDQVALCDELAYLHHYIELNQMRFGDQIDIQVTESVADDQVRLPPLMAVVLLENAFKHGVAKLGEAAWITLDVQADSREVRFEIRNNVATDSAPGKPGIGLANLRRRLELLYGPRPDACVLRREGDVFHAALRLGAL